MMWWISSSYFREVPPESISVWGSDGHCKPSTQGIGVHCFGDFYYAIKLAEQANPWSGNTHPYPASAMVMYRGFGLLDELLPWSRGSLFLYLMISVTCLSIPAIFLMRVRRDLRSVVLFFAGPFSIPALIALDRGNSIAFSVPLLLGFALAYIEDRRSQALYFLIVCSLIKPHFAFLLILFLVIRDLRRFAIGVAAMSLVHAVFFLIWWRDYFSTLSSSLRMFFEYGKYLPVADAYPPMISVSRALYALTEMMNRDRISLLVVTHQGLPGIVVLLGAASLVFIRSRTYSRREQLLVLLPFVSMAPGTTFPYYLTFGLISLALVLQGVDREMGRRHSDLNHIASSPWLQWLLIVSIAATLNPMPIPGTSTLALPPIGTHLLAPWLWMLFLTSIMISRPSDLRRSQFSRI